MRLFSTMILTTAAIIMAAVASCSSDVHSDATFCTINPDGWAYGDTLTLASPCSDSISTGKLVIAVRHTNAYLYSNLWLELRTPVDSNSVRIDTINMPLANVYGKWYGRRSATSYIATDTLLGTYTLIHGRPAQLRHIMRADRIDDIEQIGLILIPNK